MRTDVITLKDFSQIFVLDDVTMNKSLISYIMLQRKPKNDGIRYDAPFLTVYNLFNVMPQ